MLLIPMKPLTKYMTHSTLTFAVVRDIEGFEKLHSVWNPFFEQSCLDSFFLRYEWLYTWWISYGKDSSSELFIITVYSADKLVAIAPFYIDKTLPTLSGGGKVLRFIGQGTVWKQTAQSERQDIIIASGYVERVISELATFIYQQRSHWYAASFYAIQPDSNLYQLSTQLPHKVRAIGTSMQQALSVTLAPTFGLFMERQGDQLKAQYDAAIQEVNKCNDIEFRIMNHASDVESALQSLAQVYCSNTRRAQQGGCYFDSESYVNFHEKICNSLNNRTDVEVVSLHVSSHLLASICFFRSKDVLNGYLMGNVNMDDFNFSPIFMLTMWAISRAIHNGCKRIDFLSADSMVNESLETYGGQWMPLHHIEWHKSKIRAYCIHSVSKLYEGVDSSTM